VFSVSLRQDTSYYYRNRDWQLVTAHAASASALAVNYLPPAEAEWIHERYVVPP